MPCFKGNFRVEKLFHQKYASGKQKVRFKYVYFNIPLVLYGNFFFFRLLYNIEKRKETNRKIKYMYTKMKLSYWGKIVTSNKPAFVLSRIHNSQLTKHRKKVSSNQSQTNSFFFLTSIQLKTQQSQQYQAITPHYGIMEEIF